MTEPPVFSQSGSSDKLADRAGVDQRLDAVSMVAREAGRRAIALRDDPASLEVKEKGLQDFVTRADIEVETLIRDALLGAFPDDGFLGEESEPHRAGFGGNGAAGIWVVDPIDGTSNFIRGLRHWGVSIAYVQGGRVEIGAVFDAPNDALYVAKRGGGASRNGLPISVSKTTDMDHSLAILGMSRRMGLDDYIATVRSLTGAGVDYRRLGSAAIGLARVAEGVADLYFEAHLNSWDALAGMRIVQEAGGTVCVDDLATMLAAGSPVLAHNSRIAGEVAFLADGRDMKIWPL